MAEADPKQLNVRSRFARERAADIARATGMTMTQVVEEALRAYSPVREADPPGRLVRKGKLLVMPKRGKGRVVTNEQVNALIDEMRGLER